ncbi:MAG: efflux transporter periplasmic adaptor subunit, partial [Candidatus Hydrogenedentota bacterium]
MSSRESGRGAKKLWFVVGGIILVAGLAAFMIQQSGGVGRDISGLLTFEVVEGPLLISVTESGTINAREQVVIKSEVEGQTQILYLIPEGESVKKGDLLVRLDSSQLEDQLVDMQIRVQNTEALYIDARENLAVVKSQSESDVTAAELAYQFAQEDLDKYVDGDFPLQLKDAEARVTLAEASLASAEEDLTGKERLFEKDFITPKELDTAKRIRQGTKLELELAESNMELLKGFTYDRAMTQLKSDLKETELALERAKLKASADVVQADASHKARKSEYEREQSKLEKLVGQIERTELFASTDGMVVYATTTEGKGRQEPLEEGQMVW